MATLTSKLTLTSSDLTTNALDLTTTTTFTGSHTSGLAREELKSISKTIRLSCIDGDASLSGANHQGQYIDITDNHGLKKRYVIIDGAASTVASGTLIASGTDIGSDTPANLGLLDVVGGVAVDVPASTAMHAILTAFKVAIDSAAGHNGSITVAAVSGTGDGPVNLTLTNAVAGESSMFAIDARNSTIAATFLDNTYDAAATNSKDDHPVIIDASKYTAPTIYYIKNTATYHLTNGRVFLYYDNHAGTDVMELRGGQFAYIPSNATSDLRAYTSTSGTVVEFMAVGTEAQLNGLQKKTTA